MSSVGVEKVSPAIPHKPPERSGVAGRLLAIPLVSFIVDLYGISKRKSPYLETIFTRGERVFFNAKQRTHDLTSDLKTQIDVRRADFITATVTKTRNKFSRAVMSSRKLYRRGKRGVVGFVEQKARVVLQSLPGQVVMWSVDRACGVAEAALFLVRPGLRKSKKTEMRNGHHGPLSSTSIDPQKPEKDGEGSVFGILIILTKPLELLVYAMQGIQTYLHSVASHRDHSKKNGCLSPEKESEIQSRRKVSPRKKIKTGLVNQLQRTVNYFGLSNLIPGLRRKFHIDISGNCRGPLMTSPNKAEDDDKKRKYEDILSESESESDDDLQTLDLDKYISDEDPDFKPGGGESTDSEEYREGDTESDIEFETTIGGTTQVKVKTKSVLKDSETNAQQEKDKGKLKDSGTNTQQEKGKPAATKVVDSSRTKVVDSARTKVVDSARTKEQTKTSPLENPQPSVFSPPKSHVKSSALKCSTPKPNSGKENAAPQDAKNSAASKKTPEPKHGSTENSDKKPDPKNNPLANGDKKTETKTPTNGSKKGTHGDKK